MKDVTLTAKEIRNLLKSQNIKARVTSSRGFQLDAIYIIVEKQLIEVVRELANNFNHEDLLICVQD